MHYFPELLIFEDTEGPLRVKNHMFWLFSLALSHHTPSLPCPEKPSEQCACLHLKGKSPPSPPSWQEYLEILNNLKISWLICFVPFHKMSRIPICNTNEQPPIVLIPLLFSAERASAYRNNWAFFLFIALSGESETSLGWKTHGKSRLTFLLSE